jgi:YegS/Rv2252/BmrU family lipid kinase
LKILLVFNPQAGNKRAKKLLPEVEAAFNRYNIQFDLAMTDYPQHAVELVRKCNFNNYDGIIAAGGDGVLFEAVNGYFQNPSSKRIPLGIIPIGTGNAFARDLNIESTNWIEAVRIISEGKTRETDVGKFQTHGQTYYFLNILGLGFVADVVDIVQKLKFFGSAAYSLGVLYKTVLLKSNKVTIEIDGEILLRDITFIEVSNTRYTANFLMAPNAKIDDGLFDVTVVNKISRRKLLKSFPKIFTGEHIHLKEVETFKAKQIIIECSKPKVLTPDGELVGITPVEIECLPSAIEIFRE